uniref:A-kinase anchor inhibitor 1 n=1 Tax=Laticauda laticaudata TaxID=8630 RepID=A0A8C5WRN1_LATLA
MKTLEWWDKSGTGQEETKLQNASKLIVHMAIQQAVQQFSQESHPKEKGTGNHVSLQFERGQLAKKHKKK